MREHYKEHGALDEAMETYFTKKREKNVSQGTHTCDICGKTFGFRNSIVAHIKLAHAGECLLCGELVKDMKIHMQTHTRVSGIQREKASCPICKLKVSKEGLKTHIKNMHEKKKKCEDCGELVNYHKMQK